MTGLLAGSLLLLGAAAAALVFGWASASEALIWLSIACSVGAAVCLSLAYHQSRNYGRAARPAARPRPRGQRSTRTRA